MYSWEPYKSPYSTIIKLFYISCEMGLFINLTPVSLKQKFVYHTSLWECNFSQLK